MFESVLQCPVCLDAYDLQQRVPQLLHSSHTVCASCINVLCDHASSTHIRCPLCQTGVDSAQRTNNTVVVHMMEAIQQHQVQRQRDAAESKEEKQPLASRSPHNTVVHGEDKEEEEDEDDEEPGAASTPSAPSAAQAKKKKKNKKKKKKNRAAAVSASADVSFSSSSSSSASSSSSPSVPAPVSASSSSSSSASPAAAPSFHVSRLTDTRLFPAYTALPEPWEPNSRHYVVRNGKRYPRYHWAYVGEIGWLQHTGQTLTMQLVDRTWKRVTCMLALTWQEVDIARFKVGWTVVIRYAEARKDGGRLGDTMDCLIPDDTKLVTTLPVSLAGLLEFDADLAAGEERRRAAGGAAAAADPLASQCAHCEAPGPSKMCVGCRVAEYCSRDCQTAHWKESHKSNCRIWAGLRDVHLDVGDELQGEPPRSYSLRELTSAPPESRMQTEWVPFKKSVWIREL